MRTWKLYCVAGALFTCLVVWTAARGQAPPAPGGTDPAPLSQALPPPTDLAFPVRGSTIEPPPAAPPAPKPPTIDEMLDQLADIRAKKAELEKQEQATIKALRDKFKAHKERLAKMGVALEEPPAKSAEGTTELPPKIDIPPLDAAKNHEKK